MTKKSANRAVEKAQIARTAEQETSGTYKKKTHQDKGKRRQEGYRNS